MRDPNNIQYINKIDKPDIIHLKDIPEYDLEEYDYSDPKDFNAYIRDVKKMCRNSYSYRKFVSFLRDNLQMNKCSIYNNVSNIDTSNIKIHIHHDPFDLETICYIVFNKRRAYKEDTNVSMVAKEVMFLHYKLMIGLIPLAETPHEAVHAGYLFIPIDAVFGRYYEFYNLYERFMEQEHIDKYNEILEASKTLRYDTDILETDFLYIDATGEYRLPKLESIKEMLENRRKQNNNFIINKNNNKLREAIILL